MILVGEIRDEETADIAFQAAMTGHMVLSSLHAQNAASAIARLKDMGVDPGLIATSLNCIVAQRLARKLCESCRESYVPDRGRARRRSACRRSSTARTHLYRAAGCEACSFTGYAGRVGLFEVMPIRGDLRGLIEGSTEEIFAAAVAGRDDDDAPGRNPPRARRRHLARRSSPGHRRAHDLARSSGSARSSSMIRSA